MSFKKKRDDELSSQDALEGSSKAAERAEQQEADNKTDLQALKLSMLKDDLTKGQLAALKQQETDRMREAQAGDDEAETFGTKTHLQMEEAAITDGETKVTPDQLIAETQEHEAEKQAADQEYADEDA